MGKQSGIPCSECNYRFPDDTKFGKVKCPECNTAYVLTGEGLRSPLQKVSVLQPSAKEARRREIHWSGTKDEFHKGLYIQPEVKEEKPIDHTVCYFCSRPLDFSNSVFGEVFEGRAMVKERIFHFINRVTGEVMILPEEYRIPIPEKVSSCENCIGKLDKVLPHKENLMTDKWTKTTGARKQHGSRNVPESRRHEARSDMEPMRQERGTIQNVDARSYMVGDSWLRHERFNVKKD